MAENPAVTRIIPPITGVALGAGGDHGTLIGLTDDDHTQYLTTARAATWLLGKDHSDIGAVTWPISQHIGTANFIAGFDSNGDPISINPTSIIGTTDHASLISNLLWSSSGHLGTINTLASFDGAGATSNTAFGATPTANIVVQADGTGNINTGWINYDDTTIGDTGGQLVVKDSGISEGKLSFAWETTIIAASAFSFSATRSTFTLATAASSHINVLDGAQLLRNGINDQIRVTTTTVDSEWSISGTTLSVHGDITSSGSTFKLIYVTA